jgi:hypothetical protein
MISVGYQGKCYETRYPELAYRNIIPRLWRFVDVTTGSCVGPEYKSRQELLADLHRYADFFGCNS